MEIHHEEVTQDLLTGSSEVTSTKSTLPSGAEIENAKADRASAIIWYIVGVVNSLLALRIIFLFLGANHTGFASFLYDITRPFALPFKGIFPSPGLETGYFDTASLVAIIIYSLIGWGISALFDVVRRPQVSK